MKTRIVWLFLLFAVLGMGLAAETKRETKRAPSRLMLAPNQRLEMAATFVQQDSFTIAFAVTVPAAQKFQRHRCVIAANRKFVLHTAPAQRWALRGDTLMVLSEIQLTLRAKAEPSQPFEMKFDFVNLDAKPNTGGTAVLATAAKMAAPVRTVVEKSSTPALAPAKLTAPDTTAKIRPAHASTKNDGTKKDTSAAQTDVASGSMRTKATAAPEPYPRAENNDEEGRLWIPIAFLLLGIALIALLSVVSRTKKRPAKERTNSRIEPMASFTGHAKTAMVSEKKETAAETPRPATWATPVSKSEATTFSSFTPAREESVSEMFRAKEMMLVIPAVPALDLFADERMPLVTPASFQTALHKLRDLTTETQKALAVQFQALEQFSRQTENVRGFLLENSPAAEKDSGAGASSAPHQNGHGRAGGEANPAGLSLRVFPADEKGESVEELASAIDGLIAASATKPLTAPAMAMAQKIESLRRIGRGLQELAGICRALSLAAPLANVEILLRKVLDLQVSCEAWQADQSVKLSFSLPRPAHAGAPARREIVESIVDSLYETRKIAVQGPIYFERRVTQLLEYDLPKLRQQFKEIENEEMRRVWEGWG